MNFTTFTGLGPNYLTWWCSKNNEVQFCQHTFLAIRSRIRDSLSISDVESFNVVLIKCNKKKQECTSNAAPNDHANIYRSTLNASALIWVSREVMKMCTIQTFAYTKGGKCFRSALVSALMVTNRSTGPFWSEKLTVF